MHLGIYLRGSPELRPLAMSSPHSPSSLLSFGAFSLIQVFKRHPLTGTFCTHYGLRGFHRVVVLLDRVIVIRIRRFEYVPTADEVTVLFFIRGSDKCIFNLKFLVTIHRLAQTNNEKQGYLCSLGLDWRFTGARSGRLGLILQIPKFWSPT
jgi:hypothetical protein